MWCEKGWKAWHSGVLIDMGKFLLSSSGGESSPVERAVSISIYAVKQYTPAFSLAPGQIIARENSAPTAATTTKNSRQ
jgi:hypothetical protein